MSLTSPLPTSGMFAPKRLETEFTKEKVIIRATKGKMHRLMQSSLKRPGRNSLKNTLMNSKLPMTQEKARPNIFTSSASHGSKTSGMNLRMNVGQKKGDCITPIARR